MSRSPHCWRSAATCRTGFAAPCPRRRLRTIEVGGLSVGATHELLRARLDATFPRPTLIRLWETSQRQPLLRARACSALQRRGGTLAPGEELPIPSDLDELLRARLDGLGPLRSRSRAPSRRSPSRPSRSSKRPSAPRFEPGLAEALDGADPRAGRRAAALHASAARVPRSPHARRPARRRSLQRPARRDRPVRRGARSPPRPRNGRARATRSPRCSSRPPRTAQARGAPAAAAELAEQALRLTPAIERG